MASRARKRRSRARSIHARILEDNDFREFKISCKASDVFLAVAAYQGLAEACDYPLHLGITEAGALAHGNRQIGDRTGPRCCGPASAIRSEFAVGRSGRGGQGWVRDFKALGLRRRGVTVVALPVLCAPAI